jgi:hypothetical protein
MDNSLLNTNGTPKPLDQTIRKCVIDSVKGSIEYNISLLEKKRDEKKTKLSVTTNRELSLFIRGEIFALNQSINQLDQYMYNLK